MLNFWTSFNQGLYHILNLSVYDHLLLLMVLIVPYNFKDWKKCLILISFFTLAHTIALFFALFNVFSIPSKIAQTLFLITLLILALYNLLLSGKIIKKEKFPFINTITLAIGSIHGLSFPASFHFENTTTNKMAYALQLALGIEIGQILAVAGLFLFLFVLQNLFHFNKRDLVIMLSSFVAGVVVSLALNTHFFVK